MARVVGLGACIAAAAGGSAGCKKAGESDDKKAGAKSNGLSEATQRARSFYAKGYNSLVDDPNKMLKEFFENVPPSGSPAKGKKVRLFPRHNFADKDIKEAEEAFTQAGAAGSEIAHLAPLASQALSAIKKAHSVFREAHSYYDAEDYKDDAGAKGKKFIAAMKKAAAEFQQGQRKLSEALSALEDKETLAELDRFRKKKGPSFLFRNLNFKGKKLLNAMRDTTLFAAKHADMVKAYEELQAWQKANEPSTGFKGYIRTADHFHNTSKKLKRALAEKPVKQRQVQQLSNQTISAYNTMITVSNAMYQIEASGNL